MSEVINLSKGQKIDLTKTNAGLRNMLIGLGWDERSTTGVSFDLDAVAILLDADGAPIAEKPIVFYNQLTSECGGIAHSGDNTTGAGEGDDEFMTLDLAALSDDVAKIIFATTIHEAEENGVTFGQVTNAFVRLVDMGDDLESVDDDTELARFDLSEDYSTETALVMGELYRHNGEWKFAAVGQGYDTGLPGLLEAHGLATD